MTRPRCSSIGPPWLAMRTRADVDVAKVLILDATGTALGEAIAGDLAGGVQGTGTAPRVLVVGSALLRATTDSLRGRLLAKDLSGLLSRRFRGS